ncbi:MAG: PocR ligand-binding domain-containing protein [Methylococcaceae bacterium]|nr:PocR ligand-binding domain-containing protein [Methylococcaceae bacterium]
MTTEPIDSTKLTAMNNPLFVSPPQIPRMSDPLISDWNAALLKDDNELARLIDFSQLNQMFDDFLEVIGLPVCVVDLNAHVLASSRWQRLCMEFHRVNADTCARCIESDLSLSGAMRQGGDYAIYRCRNGLTDCASPIVIEGRHIANLFIGQFLLAPPDLAYFKRQAAEFGFDEAAYLDALGEVPVIAEARLPAILRFLTGFANWVVTTSLAQKRKEAMQAELEQRVRERTQELFQSRQMLQLVLDTIPQGVFWKARDLSYLGGNQPFLKDSGVASQEELIGRTDEQLSWGMTADRYRADDAQVMESGIPKTGYEEPIIRPNGQQGWVRTSKLPLRNADGSVFGLLGVYEDITQRKAVEAELQRSNAELEQFAYAVSHDMRQPLRMITSYLQLIEKALNNQLDADTRQYLNFATEGARRMDGMILALLDFSRVGRKTEPMARLEIREALDEALAFLGPERIATTGRIEISGEWPCLVASRDEMVRLFQNLVGNALKYHEADQVPRVSICGNLQPKVWRCEIRDQGIGIDPTQIGRLFQVFSRLQAQARFEGVGVGLALCRKIVEHHGGRIGVESAGEGMGSTFWVELPLAAVK